MSDTVVVTGLGVVSPFNPDGEWERFWASLCAGETAVKEIRSFDASAYSCRVAAEVPRDQLADGSATEEPALRMAEVAFERALEDAGIRDLPCAPRRAGVIVGTVLGGTTAGERYLRAKPAKAEAEPNPPVPPFAKGGRRGDLLEAEQAVKGLTQYPLRAIAARLAETGGFAGPVLTVSTACASGTDAIGLAYRAITSGKADLIVAGGADAVCELSFSGFCALKALTADKVRPFSRNRTGLALGEGAAFLVLERWGSAARSATPLGAVVGYASRGDAFHLTAPPRDGRGLAAAAAAALTDGACRPDDIDYVSAHGTGTPYNDSMETKAIKAALGAWAGRVSISSVKGALGHPFGAAGAIEAAVCLLAMRDGIVPPTANLEEPDPECDLDFVPGRAREVKVRTALSLSAGFGGQNAALVIRRWP